MTSLEKASKTSPVCQEVSCLNGRLNRPGRLTSDRSAYLLGSPRGQIDRKAWLWYDFGKKTQGKRLMVVEKTVSELAEILGVSRQAINNRIKTLDDDDVEKNDKGVTVVKRSGLIKLEEIYKKTIFEDEPISDEVKHREFLEILVDEKNTEITRLYDQLKAKDKQLAEMTDQLKVKDVQIAEKDKQIDQQQQLTLTALKERDVMKLELDEAKVAAEQLAIEPEKKGFFARLFKK